VHPPVSELSAQHPLAPLEAAEAEADHRRAEERPTCQAGQAEAEADHLDASAQEQAAREGLVACHQEGPEAQEGLEQEADHLHPTSQEVAAAEVDRRDA
jgi:hypothetical protein